MRYVTHAATLLIGLAVGLLWTPEHAPSGNELSAHPGDGGALDSKLSDMAAAIDEVARTVSSLERRLDATPIDSRRAPVAESPARAVDDPADQALSDRLERILAQLESRFVAPEEPIPTNRDRVNGAVNLWWQDPQAVLEEHFCWSPHQIYAKFGAPDRLTTSGARLVFSYKLDQERALVFRFLDNVLTLVLIDS